MKSTAAATYSRDAPAQQHGPLQKYKGILLLRVTESAYDNVGLEVKVHTKRLCVTIVILTATRPPCSPPPAAKVRPTEIFNL